MVQNEDNLPHVPNKESTNTAQTRISINQLLALDKTCLFYPKTTTVLGDFINLGLEEQLLKRNKKEMVELILPSARTKTTAVQEKPCSQHTVWF